ncbi:unnamed protein product [Paramecium primaurelia]|uniref:Transmembrane protein n=1 Tax=Paramecium primaurelia TaxID=5886 RepID=A0A8S1PWZ0_PARPR|nr:unnamed protein product [Paramecium primaurelia]
MDNALNSLLIRPQNKQIKDLNIKYGQQNEKYPVFQTQFNCLYKCQILTEMQGECLEFRSTNHKTYNKSPLVRQKHTKEQNVKQLPSLTQQIHNKFVVQKQKELVQLLTISFTILVFIVLMLEYYQQKKRMGFYDY